MSHFYGTIDGARTSTATKTGTKNSGLVTHAAGWNGAIRVDIGVDENGKDTFVVSQVEWRGSGVNRELCAGVLGE